MKQSICSMKQSIPGIMWQVEAVGCMESCYFKTLEYTSKERTILQSISNFQVLQHRMVDMFIESELSQRQLKLRLKLIIILKKCINMFLH